MERILKKIVNKYFTALFQDYDASDLDVAVLKGRVRLEKAVVKVAVLQALLGLRFVGIRRAELHGIAFVVPYSKLSSESVRLEIDRVVLDLVEPDSEIELEPLPGVFASKDADEGKNKDAKGAKPKKKKQKRGYADTILENLSFQIADLSISFQPRAREPLNGGDPVRPAALSVNASNVALDLVDEKWQVVRDKDVPKLLARSKVDRTLTLRKILSFDHIYVGNPGAAALLSIPQSRVEMEVHRHTRKGVVSFSQTAVHVGILSAKMQNSEYDALMSSLEGLLWTSYREQGAVSAAETTKHQRRVSSDEANLIDELEELQLDDDEDSESAGPSDDAVVVSEQSSLSTYNVSVAIGGVEVELRDSSTKQAHSVTVGVLSADLTSNCKRAATLSGWQRTITATTSIKSLKAGDSLGSALIAQQLQNDSQEEAPPLLHAMIKVALATERPFGEPMAIDLSLETSPLRMFLERGSLQHLLNEITSSLPVLPPSPPRTTTGFAMVRPERASISVLVGSLTFLTPAPLGVPFTHDVRAVLGPLQLVSDPILTDAFAMRGSVAAAVFLTSVPTDGRGRKDTKRSPPPIASVVARSGETAVLAPVNATLSIHMGNFVQTIESLVNVPGSGDPLIMPSTQSIDVSLRAGFAVHLTDALMASLVQGWFPVLQLFDSSKERKNKAERKRRKREQRMAKLLKERVEDGQERKKRRKRKLKDDDNLSRHASQASSKAASRQPSRQGSVSGAYPLGGVPSGLVGVAQMRVPWHFHVQLEPQGDVPLVLFQGREGAPISLLDMFETVTLEEWAAIESPVMLLRLHPRALVFDVTHHEFGAFESKLFLQQVTLDLCQPLMVAPLSIHSVPADKPKSDEDSMAGVHLTHKFTVPRSSQQYPHSLSALLSGQHVTVCEHGPLGIKPLKNMIKTFYWRVVQGLELTPSPLSLTTFPLWAHADADVSDCTAAVMRNGALSEYITRDFAQLVVHRADKRLLAHRTASLESKMREAEAVAAAANESAMMAQIEAHDANVTLASVKMALFELQAEREAQQKHVRDAVRARDQAVAQSASVATTYNEVMQMVSSGEKSAGAAAAVQRLADDKIALQKELTESKAAQVRLARQVEQLEEKVARLTGGVVAKASPLVARRATTQAKEAKAAKDAQDAQDEAAGLTKVPSFLSRIKSKAHAAIPVRTSAAQEDTLVSDTFDVSLVGDVVRVTYAFGTFQSNSWDWLGLYNKAENNPKSYVEFKWKKGAVGQLDFKKPADPGLYEVRCFRGQSRKMYYSAIAVSNTLAIRQK